MPYDVVDLEQVPVEVVGDDTPKKRVQNVHDHLDTEHSRIAVWYFDPGEAMPFHAHTSQEEVYYVLKGEFEVSLGAPEEPTEYRVDAGSFFRAIPEAGRGYENVGDELGVVIVFATPDVDDHGRDPEEAWEDR